MLINPNHPQFKQAEYSVVRDFNYDNRLK